MLLLLLPVLLLGGRRQEAGVWWLWLRWEWWIVGACGDDSRELSGPGPGRVGFCFCGERVRGVRDLMVSPIQSDSPMKGSPNEPQLIPPHPPFVSTPSSSPHHRLETGISTARPSNAAAAAAAAATDTGGGTTAFRIPSHPPATGTSGAGVGAAEGVELPARPSWLWLPLPSPSLSWLWDP